MEILLFSELISVLKEIDNCDLVLPSEELLV